MSAPNLELTAEIAAYADTMEPLQAWPAMLLLGRAATARDVSRSDVASLLDGLAGTMNVPSFSDWATTPEATTAVGSRVELQEIYEREYAGPVQQMLAAATPAVARPGRYFVGFPLEVEGEAMVAKMTLSNPVINRVSQVHAQSSALIVARGLHPLLEQIRGLSYRAGSVVSERIFGDAPTEVSAETLHGFTTQHVDDALALADLAASRSLRFDYDGDNTRVRLPEGVSFLDFYLARKTDAETLRRLNREGLLHTVVGRLGISAAPAVLRHHRARLYAYTQQRVVS